MLDICVKYANDSGIPKGMGVRLCFGRYYHNKGMSARIDGVVGPPHIIGCVIDACSRYSKNVPICQANSLSIRLSKSLIRITIEGASEKTS